MIPLRPAVFTTENLGDGWWLADPANRTFRDLLRFTGARFPSVILAYAARPGLEAMAEMVAAGVSQAGLNVFLAEAPTPVCALVQAVGRRGMPLGLYLDEQITGQYSLLPLGNHGGPIIERDLPEAPPDPLDKLGVVGSTDIMTPYLASLRELLDPFPDTSPRVARLDNPFEQLSERLREGNGFRILTEREEKGATAAISPDGQSLTWRPEGGEPMPTRDMVQILGEYLTLVRRTSGTVVGPKGATPLRLASVENLQIEGEALDMSAHASCVDLLLGWWEPGLLAHQGNGPFGDAFLTLAYLLEALATRRAAG